MSLTNCGSPSISSPIPNGVNGYAKYFAASGVVSTYRCLPR